MPFYEHVFVARQDATPQAVDALIETLKGVVTEQGGQTVNVENWGVRSLAYRIKKNRKGHYVMMILDAPATAVAELERQQRINEDILRYLTVRLEGLEEGPSAMMRARDRDERRREFGDRDGGFGGERSRDDRPREDRPRRPREGQTEGAQA